MRWINVLVRRRHGWLYRDALLRKSASSTPRGSATFHAYTTTVVRTAAPVPLKRLLSGIARSAGSGIASWTLAPRLSLSGEPLGNSDDQKFVSSADTTQRQPGQTRTRPRRGNVDVKLTCVRNNRTAF